MDTIGLLGDITQAERENVMARACQACEVLEQISDSETLEAVKRALSGTIGLNKLATILRSNGFSIGKRAIDRHRREEH